MCLVEFVQGLAVIGTIGAIILGGIHAYQAHMKHFNHNGEDNE